MRPTSLSIRSKTRILSHCSDSSDGQPLWPQGFDPLNVQRIDGGVFHTRFIHLGNDSGQIEAVESETADIEAMIEAAGSHPQFNGVRRVVLTGLAEPELETSSGSVVVRASGVTAGFQGATATRDGNEVIVRLGD